MSISATQVLVWRCPRYCQTGFALAIVVSLCFEDKRRRRIYGLADGGDCKERMKESAEEREREGGRETGRERQQTCCDNISRTSVSCPVRLNNADCNYRKQREFVSVVMPLLFKKRLKRNEMTSVGFENILFEICLFPSLDETRRIFLDFLATAV